MAKPVSISLSKFTSSVQAAVKAAAAKHPKFQLPTPHGVTVSYLIRGIPVPEEIMAKVSFAETQAFATDVAGHIAQALPEVSVGRYVICGIPAPPQLFQIEA
jgi:DNA primase